MSVRYNTGSGGVEDSLPEQVQLGPSIHLAFEELEPGHLALRLAIAVRKLAGGAHGGILLEARREAFQVWQPTRQDRLDPCLQLAGCPRPYHPGKGLGQRRNLSYRRIMLLELRHLCLRVSGRRTKRYESCRAVRLGGCVALSAVAGRAGSEDCPGCPQRKVVTYRYTTA